MPKISTYTTVTPQGDDKIIVTQTSGTPSEVTKNVTVDGLKTFVNANAAVTSLTTTGVSGVATLTSGVLNIPTPPFTANTSSATGIESSSNTASGSRSTAMGVNSTASGYISTAMGSGTTANGSRSTAMGDNTEASGNYSTSMGDSTTASGTVSTAMGESTTSSGISSTAMGNGTEASGDTSTAMGNSTISSGDYSTAMGSLTTASGFGSIAIGQHNVLNSGDAATSFNLTNTALSIGNGTSSAAKSDAFSVLFNGNTTAAGSVTAESLNIAALNTAPVSATAPGTIGEIKFTDNHIYVCVDDNTWRRVAIATF